MTRLTLLTLVAIFGAAVSGVASAQETIEANEGFYGRIGALTSLYHDASFKDRNCDPGNGNAVFGCGRGHQGAGRQAAVEFDWDKNIGAQVGLGVHVAPWLRVEGDFDYQFDLNVSGNSNFSNFSTANQKFSSELEVAALTMWAIIDSPKYPLLFGRGFNVYGGIGGGASRLSLNNTKIDFPNSRTVIPDGETFNPVFGVTAGMSHEITDQIALDLGWRYMNYGQIETGSGGGSVVPRIGEADPKDYGPIEADLHGSEFLASLRVYF